MSMLWNVAAPFFRPDRPANHPWLDDFVVSDRHRFNKIPFGAAPAGRDWHARATRGTPLSGWLDYWRTASAAVQKCDGLITVFPQLAVTSAVRRALTLRKKPVIVAWCFNIGRFPGGARQAAARAALGRVERFVVHSTAEIALVAKYLGIPEDRVRFVPLQRAPITVTHAEEEEQPFALAMGSANRDYATLVEAARLTGLPLRIVASPRDTQHLSLPPNVTVQSGLTSEACRILAQRARFSVVPLADVGAASGQITVIEAQRMRRAVIATRSIGTVDYIHDGETGLLVPGADARALAERMTALWSDAPLRGRLGEGAGDFADRALSDPAAAAALAAILDEFV
jgi:glycosyltransferase involved in cell wall biosynthesis